MKIILGHLNRYKGFEEILKSYHNKIIAAQKILDRILVPDVSAKIRRAYENDLFDGLFGADNITATREPYKPFISEDWGGICIGLYQTGPNPRVLFNGDVKTEFLFKEKICWFEFPFIYTEIPYTRYQFIDCQPIKIAPPKSGTLWLGKRRLSGIMMNGLFFDDGIVYERPYAPMDTCLKDTLSHICSGDDSIPWEYRGLKY